MERWREIDVRDFKIVYRDEEMVAEARASRERQRNIAKMVDQSISPNPLGYHRREASTPHRITYVRYGKRKK